MATTGSNTANNCLTQATPCQTLPYAIGQAVAGDTIKVAAGTYVATNVAVNKSLTLEGAKAGIPAAGRDGTGETVLNASASTTGGLVVSTGTTTVDGFTISGAASADGIRATGGTGHVFTNNILDSNSIGVHLSPSSGVEATLTNNVIKGSTSSGVHADGNNVTVTITGNNITGNAVGVLKSGPGSLVTMTFNRIAGNTTGVSRAHSGGTVTALNNWWGCNAGPNDIDGDCDTNVGVSAVPADPWLVLTAGVPSPELITPGGATSTVTANLLLNSNDESVAATFPNGTPIAFSTDLGSVAPPSPGTTAAVATSTLTSGAAQGDATVTATLDSESVTQIVRIYAIPVPLTPPTVAGTLKVGKTIRCENGTWQNAETFGYRWFRDGELIEDAPKQKQYTLTGDDLGSMMSCRVIGYNPGGHTLSQTANSDSAAAGPVQPATAPPTNINPPTISGIAQVTKKLTCNNTLADWTGAESLGWRWLRNGTVIASGKTYILVPADVGTNTITCRAIGYNEAGNTSADSAPVSVIP